MTPKSHNSQIVVLRNLIYSTNKLAEYSQYFLLSIVFILLALQTTNAATPSDTLINNIATANYQIDGSQETLTASVAITTDANTPSTISFHRLSNVGEEATLLSSAYNSSESGGKLWNPINSVTRINGDKIVFPSPVKITEANQFIASEPVIIRVQDFDQNRDPNKSETIFVTITIPETGDKEVIQLKETSPSSGVFIGAVPTQSSDTAISFDGKFDVKRGAKLTVSYRDQEDKTDLSATAALIDPVGTLNLTKTADKKSASVGDTLSYEITLRNSSVDKPLNDIKIQDTLPVGVRYQNNTAFLNNKALPATAVVVKGRSLTFTLGNMPSNVDAGWVLRYKATIGVNTPIADAINRAQAFSQNDTSNIAKATVHIDDVLMKNTSIITGRVYIGCDKSTSRKTLANARVYTESGRSVLSDNDGYWHMEGLSQQAHVIQLDVDSLPTGYRAINCDHDNDRAGSNISKFVNSKTLWRADFYVEKASITNLLEKSTQKTVKAKDPLKQYNKAFVNKATPGFEILWPPNNYVPAIASTKIAIKHSPQQKVKLYLNDKPISMLNYDGSVTNKSSTVTIRRWRGVDINIKQKNNILTAILLNKKGKEIARKTHTIHFSGSPSSVEYLEKESLLIADGKNSPIITLRIKDEDGFPMRANTHGYFSLQGNDYTVASNNKNKSIDDSGLKGKYKYYIKEGGITHIKLNPSTRSGQVTIDFNLTNKTQTIHAWLKPKLRNWVLVGIAEGTLAHNKISGNLQTLNDKNQAETYKHGRLALFAKGRIKGDYLLTLAYDTNKKRSKNYENGAQLEGNIDPDSWYTVYADRSDSQYETSSSNKLYLKLEKDQFYALFGDYRTGLTVTELSRYERVLEGIQSQYNGKEFGYNLFASYTDKRHQRDEIIGDGTSGLYYLSRSIVQNSEVIRLEALDQFDSGKVVSSQTMVRHKDYDIDYNSRTLFFKFPIPARDRNLNINVIVVDYESDDSNEKTLVAGGRVAAKFDNGKLETGLSIIHEGNIGNSDNATGRLIGLDSTYKPNDTTKLHAEIAQTNISSNNTTSQGKAWLAEIKKTTENTESSAYIRQQDESFGLGHQKISQQGTKKIGISSRYKLNEKVKLKGELLHQQNLKNNDVKQSISIEAEKQFNHSNLSIGLRQSENTSSSDSSNATALLLGGSISTKDGKASLHGNIEKKIAGRNHISSVPDKAIIGLDVAVNDKINLFAEHEATDDGKSTTQKTRVGISSSLWEGAKVKTSLSRENKTNRSDTYAMVGLSQHVKLSDHLLIDLSLDQAKTIDSNSKQTTSDNDTLSEHKNSRDDYIATSLAYKWKDNNWSSLGRLEYRNGDLEDKMNVQLELNHKIADGKKLTAKISSLHSNKNTKEQQQQTTISLGAAWQPFDASYSLLERLDYVNESETNSTSNKQTRKLINNIHINKQFDNEFELGLHHGIKHIMSSNDAEQKENSTNDVGLIEAKYKLNKMWAIGAHAGYSRDWDNNNIEKVAGVSVSASPAKNTHISIGYNIEGFTDSEFDTSGYTNEGFFTQILYKFDQETLKLNQYDNNKVKTKEEAKP